MLRRGLRQGATSRCERELPSAERRGPTRPGLNSALMRSGHDAVAPDGCPVAIYRRFPPAGEPEIIHGAVPAGCDVLELGGGAGRITHALTELGHHVGAVDNSPDMLESVRGTETILATLLLSTCVGASRPCS